jgi:site-specific recombinase
MPHGQSRVSLETRCSQSVGAKPLFAVLTGLLLHFGAFAAGWVRSALRESHTPSKFC